MRDEVPNARGARPPTVRSVPPGRSRKPGLGRGRVKKPGAGGPYRTDTARGPGPYRKPTRPHGPDWLGHPGPGPPGLPPGLVLPVPPGLPCRPPSPPSGPPGRPTGSAGLGSRPSVRVRPCPSEKNLPAVDTEKPIGTMVARGRSMGGRPWKGKVL